MRLAGPNIRTFPRPGFSRRFGPGRPSCIPFGTVSGGAAGPAAALRLRPQGHVQDGVGWPDADGDLSGYASGPGGGGPFLSAPSRVCPAPGRLEGRESDDGGADVDPQFHKAQPYLPKAVIGIDSNETNLTAYVAASGEMREIDTSYAARVSRDHERRARRGQRGKQNPRVRRKVAARHGRLRREKVATFWQGGALTLMAWAASLGAALVLEDLKGMKGRLARQERRGLLNFWGVMTFHGVLASKAAFYGVPLLFVDPRDTSRSCPVCG